MGFFDLFRRSKPSMPSLSADAQTLFAEITRDPKGELIRVRVPGQVIWETNQKQFIDEKGPQEQGRWKIAIEELVRADFIGPIGIAPYRVYLITKGGAKFKPQ
jgi:hypothetical protein